MKICSIFYFPLPRIWALLSVCVLKTAFLSSLLLPVALQFLIFQNFVHTARPELQDEQIKGKEGRLAFKELVYIFISNNCLFWFFISFRGFVNIISCQKLNLRPNDIDTLEKELNHLNQRVLVCQQHTLAAGRL